jgi:hypothetical protein
LFPKNSGDKKRNTESQEYDSIWTETLAYHNDDESPPSKRHCRDEDPIISRKSLYNDIFDNIVVQVQKRFGSLPHCSLHPYWIPFLHLKYLNKLTKTCSTLSF